jgi:hypothetical protein
MADDGGVAAKLAGAKATLDSVNNSNVSAKQSPFAPKHEFSNASYKLAKSAGKSGGTSDSGIASEAHSAGEGIKARMENESAAKASLQQ